MADKVIVTRVLAFLTLVSCGLAAEAPKIPIDPTRSGWVRVATANFELYTTADEGAGRSLILQLERLRTLLQPVLSWRVEPLVETRVEAIAEGKRPICIIAFGSHDEFLPYAPISRSIGFFLPGKQRDFVVLDGSHAESRAAAHEYVHFLVAQSGLRLPTWLNEGVAELYSNLEEGRPGHGPAIGRFIPGRVLSLRRGAWFDLAGLVSASSRSDFFTSPARVDSAYAESWLLAHMLVLDPRYAPGFPDFLVALQTSETTEAFRRVYGKSLAQVEQELNAYLEVGESNARILGDSAAPAELPVQVERREADFDGRMALIEMLRNYSGRVEQSQDLYRRLALDYPRRLP
jgi:hypothetical protein